MIGTTKTFLGLTTAMSVVHAASAFAQATPVDTNTRVSAPQSSAPGDIVVTARRSEERLQDVPISITVFNQQQLNSRNIVQAADLATYTPSLSANSFFGSSNTSFSIRGFNQQFGTSPTVGVYFADVISPRAASNNIPVGDGAGPGSFFDLQNVQVLKGPQGTLFGLNTTGGAVLLVPQKPTDKFEGYIEGSYGNYDMKRIQGVVNVPLGDKARFRVGVDHQSSDGYLKNNSPIGPKDFNDINYTAIRASLVLDLTPTLENYTIVSYSRSNTNGDLQALSEVNPAASDNLADAAAKNPNFLPFAFLAAAERARYGNGFYQTGNSLANPSTKLTQWQILNTTTWQASDNLTVKNIVSYAQLKEDIVSSLFGTYLDLYDLRVTINGLGTIYPYRGGYPTPGKGIIVLEDVVPIPGGNTANQSTFTEEFQLQGHALGGRLQYQGGAYLELSDPLGRQGAFSFNLVYCQTPTSTTCINPTGAGSVGNTFGEKSFRDIGLYSQATYSFTDRLKLTGGIRYTRDRQQDAGQQFSYLYDTSVTPIAPQPLVACANPEGESAPTCAYSLREKSSAPTWLIDLDYKPIRNILFYAKYSRGYRAGGVTAGVPFQYSTYEPEKLDAYEVGLKTSFRGAISGTFNVAGFYNDFHNEQTIAAFSPTPMSKQQRESGVVNADKSRSYGVEVEGTLTPFRGFMIDASYAYTNAKVTKIPPVVLPSNSPLMASSVAIDGDIEQLVPKNKYTINGTYLLPLAASVGKVSLGATFSHFDSQVANYGNRGADGNLLPQSIIGPRNLLDFNANWNGIAGSQFDVQLFATNVTGDKYYLSKTGLYSAVGFELASIGPPRMYGGRLRFHFGQ